MEFYRFTLATLAVWRVTHLLSVEDDPWGVIGAFRRLAASVSLNKVMECFYCLSLWTAAPAAVLLGVGLIERLILWLSISGGAILVNLVANRLDVSRAIYIKDAGEDSDVMLRKKDE